METLFWNWSALVCVALLLLFFLKLCKSSRERIKDLRQKAVLVTGCDSGFGHELAERLDAVGVTVYAGVLFPEGDGASRLKQTCSSRLHILHLDVTVDDHVAEAVKAVANTLGNKKLWAVVNNAGIATLGGFEWIPVETLKKVMDVNTIGPARITAAFLPMLKESRGRVVIVASVAGHYGIAGMSAYLMSKHAVVAFGDTIRKELRNWSVSVHLIKPYMYKTNIANPETLREEMRRNWEAAGNLKNSYPDTYLEDGQKCLTTILSLSLPKSKTYEVVNDMEDATIGLHPKVSYYPGVTAKLYYFLYIISPTFVLDYVGRIFWPPAHKGGKNKLVDFLHARLSK